MRRGERDPLFQKKSLGQVFLQVDWPLRRMVETLRGLGVQRVIEIGPGPGNLTKELLAGGLAVTAVEKDDRFAERLLAAVGPTLGAKLNVVNDDILAMDWGARLGEGGGPAAVVGNIPYNISSPILLKGIAALGRVEALLFMTQLEFAARVAARPSTKDFGSLSVFTQLRASASLEFEVGRDCFQPVPKVDSAVLLVRPKAAQLPAALLERAEQVTRAAFNQRRKKLRNSVKQFLEARGEAGCPIDLNRRADALAPEEFVQLAEYLLG